MNDYVNILKDEFSGTKETFIYKLRFERQWDRELLNNLIKSMYAYCQEHNGEALVERWATSGFHMCMDAVPRWSEYSNVKREYGDVYYELACRFFSELHNHLCSDKDVFDVRYDSINDAISELNEL